MRSFALTVGGILLAPLVAGLIVPFDNADLGLERRNTQMCPRVKGKYEFCDAVTKCCQPGYGCNTCGEGNVGQTCVKREKDGCKKDSDCYWSQKCIDNGKEPSFCAQLWVDDLPKPKEKKQRKKKKPTPTHHLNASSLAPSGLHQSSLAPSGLHQSSLAPSSMMMAKPTPVAPVKKPKQPEAMPTPKPKAGKKEEPKKEEPAKKEEPKKETSKKEEPQKEEPKKMDEPKKEEPKKQEPKKAEEPKKQEPKKEESPKKDSQSGPPKN